MNGVSELFFLVFFLLFTASFVVQMTSWGELPPEVLLKLARFLPVGEWGSMRRVCKGWKGVLESAYSKVTLSGSALLLPQNMAIRFPGLIAMDLLGCVSISAKALECL